MCAAIARRLTRDDEGRVTLGLPDLSAEVVFVTRAEVSAVDLVPFLGAGILW